MIFCCIDYIFYFPPKLIVLPIRILLGFFLLLLTFSQIFIKTIHQRELCLSSNASIKKKNRTEINFILAKWLKNKGTNNKVAFRFTKTSKYKNKR